MDYYYRWYLGNTSHSDADVLLKQENNTTGIICER